MSQIFFFVNITVSLNGGSHKQWQSYHGKFGLPLKTLGVAALVVPGVVMLEAEDGEDEKTAWDIPRSCVMFVFYKFFRWKCSLFPFPR